MGMTPELTSTTICVVSNGGIAIGSFTLRYYSLAYIAGIALGYWHLTRMVKAPGSPMARTTKSS